MDLYKAIRSLYEEKKRLDRLIQSLEKIQARGATPPAAKLKSRRGRRGMSVEERREVSERMKRYWAARRGEALPEPPPPGAVAAEVPAEQPSAAAAAASSSKAAPSASPVL